jgi:peptide/nickel transport system permease protein
VLFLMAKSIFKFIKQIVKHRIALVGVIIVLSVFFIAIAAPLIAPNDPYDAKAPRRFQEPSSEYPLGTDFYGRCILSRLIYGTRISIQVGFISIVIGLSIGGMIGLFAAYYGGWVDTVLMRLMDALMALPGMFIALLIISALGPKMTNAMIAIGIASFPQFSRLMRGQVLSLLAQEYVLSARASGASSFRIMMRHILPNTISTLIVMSTLRIAAAILIESSLSFLGLGVQPPTASWGVMIAHGRDFLMNMPELVTYPGLAILITVVGFNILGDGIRDILDPRLRGI